MKTFFFFGDSITLGVNDTLAGGWIGRFAGLASQRAGLSVPPSTFYNLGVRKHSSLQIRERWASEYRSRVNDATVPYLIFCFGTVDMAAPNGNVAVPMQESTQNAQAILSEAQMEAPVLMMGPPPVKNPDHLERLNKLNETYAGLCLDLGVAYLDLLKGLPAVYVADLDDGLHPGKTGNMLIAEQLLNAPIVQGWIRS